MKHSRRLTARASPETTALENYGADQADSLHHSSATPTVALSGWPMRLPRSSIWFSSLIESNVAKVHRENSARNQSGRRAGMRTEDGGRKSEGRAEDENKDGGRRTEDGGLAEGRRSAWLRVCTGPHRPSSERALRPLLGAPPIVHSKRTNSFFFWQLDRGFCRSCFVGGSVSCQLIVGTALRDSCKCTIRCGQRGLSRSGISEVPLAALRRRKCDERTRADQVAGNA